MTAPKFTLEILAAAEELKFATSFTPFLRESFLLSGHPKESLFPGTFLPLWEMGPQHIPTGCLCTHWLSLQGRKKKIKAAQVGLGRMQDSTSKDGSPEALVSQPSQDRATGGETDFPLSTIQGKLMNLNSNLALIFLRPSFLEICRVLPKRNPRQRGARMSGSACCGEPSQWLQLIKTSTVGWEFLYQTGSRNPAQIVYFTYYHMKWFFGKNMKLFNARIIQVINT